jgi:3-hydroxybutyryl-CoA dehydratase
MVKFSIGQKATFGKTFTEQEVVAFANISGDRNPLHLDAEYAKTTRFGARIAHGALTAGLISAVLGNDLPGIGTIYMSQTTKFLKPVYFGDTVTATVEITAIRTDKGILTLKTVCANQHGEIVADGEAVVFHPDAKTTSQ